ncbi:MAG: hypothetical protein AAF438_14555 [Pseudomonadota bacterium]
MLQFIARRTGIMILTALCLTFVVFFLTNLYPNLEKLAKTQGNFRMSEEQVATWLNNRGYGRNIFAKYGEWLGVVPGYVIEGTDGKVRARCARKGITVEEAPTYCGIIQGDWGYSTVSKDNAGPLLWNRLKLTGFLMMWALIITVPVALILGIFLYMLFWFPRWVLMAAGEPELSELFPAHTEWTYPPAILATVGLSIMVAEMLRRYGCDSKIAYGGSFLVVAVNWFAGIMAGTR